MARNIDSAKRVISGTWGELFLDGEKVAETTGFQAKISQSKSKINLCGQFMTDHKPTNGEGSGSITMYHVDSGMLQRLEGMQDGVDRRFTLLSALKDPDSYGAERIALYNVSFDDLSLADWKAATVGQITAAFTFTRMQLLDEIEVQG